MRYFIHHNFDYIQLVRHNLEVSQSTCLQFLKYKQCSWLARKAPGLIPRQYMWYLWCRKGLWYRFYPFSAVYPVCITEPTLRIHIALRCQQCCLMLATNSIIKQSTPKVT